MANAKKGVELSKSGASEFLALSIPGDSIQELILENVGPNGIQPLDLDRIKIPAGGALSWEIPTLTGVETAQEVSGIIVYWKDGRALWTEAFSGASTPPQCASEDAITGFGNPGGACSSCPFSQWESDLKGGKGQACKLVRRAFVVRPGDLLPVMFPLPPTSVGALHKYGLRLASQGLLQYGVVTKFSLESATSNNGIRYSRATLKMERVLEDSEKEKIRSYVEGIRPVLAQTKLSPEDYPVESPSP
jgi:hypothetical protein